MGEPATTIPPFTDSAVLPSCAAQCGPLYDANGGCVPPAVRQAGPDAYNSCFCKNSNVAAFSTATKGVCDDVCQGDGLQSIASWFRDLCSVDGGKGNNNNGGDGSGSKPTSTGSASDDDNGGGGGGDWLSNHWQWVIMIVILVVAIAGIWAGACIWRRRYLRKKDRQATWRQKQSGSASHPSWGPGTAESQMQGRGPISSMPPADDPQAAGSFMPGATDIALEEKPKKKRWLGRNRT